MIDALLGIAIGAAVLGVMAWAVDRPVLPVYCSAGEAETARRQPPWEPPRHRRTC